KDSFTVFTTRRVLDAAGLLRKEIDALEDRCADPAATEMDAPCKRIKDMSSEEALRGLGNLELDAVFQVGVLPFEPVRDKLIPLHKQKKVEEKKVEEKKGEENEDPCSALRRARVQDINFEDSEIRLFNLDVDLVERLVADGSYIEQWIPADVYCQRGRTL